MKPTLCGSIAFYDEMQAAKQELEALGHEVKLPPTEIKDDRGDMIPVKEYYARRKAETDDSSWIWERKQEAIRSHFEKIEWADAIVVVNPEKNGIPGYVGANTLIEMGLAMYLRKPVYLTHPIPDMAYKEEILGMRPTVLDRGWGMLIPVPIIN